MARFKRLGPNCLTPMLDDGRLVLTGQTVDAPLWTGWADDPDWEWVDRPTIKMAAPVTVEEDLP